MGAGQNAHRFSIEWSRVEPSQGEYDSEAIQHYRDVLQALRSRGLEPVVTLQHFTLPEWLAKRGGWANRHSVRWFSGYVAQVARELGDGVRYWVTINEPMVYLKHAYIVGDWPPGRKRAWGRAFLAIVNMARAHRAAREVLRTRHPAALVGFAHSAALLHPCDPSRSRDRMAAWLRDLVLNRAFFGLVAGFPGGDPPFDFIGLNYYTRTIVRGVGTGLIPFAGTECRADHHGDRRRRSDLGWDVYPAGLLETLRRYSKHRVPLLITENGVATTDEELRTSFLLEHLAHVGKALEEGIDVRGYFYWSLMDNFEWALGTTARFGLFGVDFSSQQRSARPVVDRFRDVCLTNELDGVIPHLKSASPSGTGLR